MPTTELNAAIGFLGSRDDVGNDVRDTDLRALVGELWTPGVFDGQFRHQATSGMTVTVGSSGDVAIVPNEAGTDRDAFIVKQLTATSVTLDPSSSTDDRTDQVWLVVRQADLDGGGQTDAALVARTGAPGSAVGGPDDPDPTWLSALRLVDYRIPAGATSPSQVSNRAGVSVLRASVPMQAQIDAAIDTVDNFVDIAGSRVTQSTPPAPTANADAYPSAITWSAVNAGDGWPTHGVLVTVRSSNSRTAQLLLGKDGSPVMVRGVQDNGPLFAAWETLVDLSLADSRYLTADAAEARFNRPIRRLPFSRRGPFENWGHSGGNSFYTISAGAVSSDMSNQVGSAELHFTMFVANSDHVQSGVGRLTLRSTSASGPIVADFGDVPFDADQIGSIHVYNVARAVVRFPRFGTPLFVRLEVQNPSSLDDRPRTSDYNGYVLLDPQ